MKQCRTNPLAFSLALVLFALGCANNPPPKTTAELKPLEPLSADIVEHNATAVELATDPCAIRMHEIGGALAIYYHDYYGFPPTLDWLLPLAKKWSLNLAFTCPESNEPYVYVPGGLAAPEQTRRLVVYDATPVHKGWRWGVVMAPPAQGMTDVTPEVVRLSADVFNVYLQSAKPQPKK